MIKLYPPQQAAIDAARAALRSLRREGKRPRVGIIAPCGFGKGVLICELASLTAAHGGKTLVMVQSKTLAKQMVERLGTRGLRVGMERAASRVGSTQDVNAVVCTVQSMVRSLSGPRPRARGKPHASQEKVDYKLGDTDHTW